MEEKKLLQFVQQLQYGGVMVHVSQCSRHEISCARSAGRLIDLGENDIYVIRNRAWLQSRENAFDFYINGSSKMV